MDFKDIANQLKNEKADIILIHAFNSTGKTRLSVAYKDVTKEQNGGRHAGVYFNAFSEDLFVWDNDEEHDNTDMRLSVLPSSLNQYYSYMLEDMEKSEDGIINYPKIQSKLDRYHPNYSFVINTYKIAGTDDDDIEKGIGSFSFYANEDIEQSHPIKISRGEERIFVWCFFLALFEIEDWIAEQGAHIFIDDPVSSLDEHNLYITADSICDIIDQNFGKKKIILTTHHIGLFAILIDRLTDGEKSSKYKNAIKVFSLSKKNGETILQQKEGVFLYHLFLYKSLITAIEEDKLYLYHFALLRLLLENIASFYGVGHPSFALSKINTDFSKLGMKDNEGVMNMIHSLSHNDRYHYMDPVVSDSEKALLKEIVDGIKTTFNFKV